MLLGMPRYRVLLVQALSRQLVRNDELSEDKALLEQDNARLRRDNAQLARELRQVQQVKEREVNDLRERLLEVPYMPHIDSAVMRTVSSTNNHSLLDGSTACTMRWHSP